MPQNHVILPENTTGRDFVVGDIHGCYDLLIQALAKAAFNPDCDRLISVGDLIDRGRYSSECLKFLQQPWFHAVRGNHEDMYLETIGPDGAINMEMATHNIKNGMAWIFNESADKRAAIRHAFEKLPIAIETTTSRGSVGFIHAEVPFGMSWQDFVEGLNRNDQDIITQALWSRKRITQEESFGVVGIDRLFVGHTPQETSTARLGNCYYVDTGAVFSRPYKEDGPDCFLTLADIRGHTRDLSYTPFRTENAQLNVITELPAPADKPFGAYAKPTP